jgi:TolB-like protein
MRKHTLLAMALTVIGGVTTAQAQDTRAGIAVLPFNNGGSYGADAEVFDALQVGMQQMVMTELSMNSNARVVDRTALKELLDEQDLGASGRVDPATAARIGQVVGAKYVVLGGFIDLYGDMRIDIRIVSVETSEVVNVAKANDRRENLYSLVVDVGTQIMDDIDLPPLPAGIQEAREAREIPEEAVTLYSRAIFYEDRGLTERAIDLYRQITNEFPQMTEAGEALKQLEQS